MKREGKEMKPVSEIKKQWSTELNRALDMRSFDPLGAIEWYRRHYFVPEDEREKQAAFRQLELFLLSYIPVSYDEIYTMKEYFQLWVEFYKLCEDKEHIIYFLEDKGIGIESIDFYELAIQHYIESMDSLLADEWIILAEKK